MRTVQQYNREGFFSTRQAADLLGVPAMTIINQATDMHIEQSDFCGYIWPNTERGVSVEECREYGINPNGGYLWHMAAIIGVATTLDTFGARALWIIWSRDLERTINGVEVRNTWLHMVEEARQLAVLLEDAAKGVKRG